MLFYLIVGAAFLFSYLVQAHLKRTYRQWSQVRNSSDLPGVSVATSILRANRMPGVGVREVGGKLSDHYDPRTKVISLSQPIYETPSVAAMAISAHECGHAIQDHEGFGPLRFRTAVVPIAQWAGRLGVPALVMGSVIGSTLLIQVGVLSYVGALLLQLLTLPVEFNASNRAMGQLQQLNLMNDQEEDGARKVLRSAAMTYVAGVASSAGYVVYLLIAAGSHLFKKKEAP